MFWKAFESRVNSDPNIDTSIFILFSKNLIPSLQLVIILKMSLRTFQSNLVTNVVKAVVVNDGSINTTESFTAFIIQQKHYTVLYKKWREVGKKRILYMKTQCLVLLTSLFINFL